VVSVFRAESYPMKEIRAYIQPFVLGRVVQALLEIPGFPGMSVLDCEGFGRNLVDADRSFSPFMASKRLEIIAADEQVDAIVRAIMTHARTGRAGDGRVFVVEVLESGKIRTGERGASLA
jgi:nitrogen regulatory protein P-II 1